MDCKQEYTKYTAFRDDDGMICFLAVEARSVEDLMCQVRGFYGGWDYPLELLAWAPEWPTDRGGRLECDDLCAESIAAGRLIEKTPSGWVALGAEKQEEERYDIDCALQYAQRELRKGEPTSADLAMIARDGPAKSKCGCQKCGGTRGGVPGNENRLNGMVLCDYCTADFLTAPSTAKPNPFPTTLRSPDCDSGPSDHLNASRHQMAGMKG